MSRGSQHSLAVLSVLCLALVTSRMSSLAPAGAPPSWPYLIPLPPSNSSDANANALLIPPLSFSLVCPGIYRSACPSARNFTFLNGLDLRSVIYLCPDSYPAAEARLFESAGVPVHSFGIEGNKEPFVGIDDEQLEKALLCALDTRHQPLLVHCNKGKHRTGCFVGILRRIAGHSLASVFAEYRQFLGATFISRDLDRLCIETFDVDRFKRTLEKLVPQEFRPDWIA